MFENIIYVIEIVTLFMKIFNDFNELVTPDCLNCSLVVTACIQYTLSRSGDYGDTFGRT